MEPIERARGLIERYERELKRLIPEGTSIFDAHVHLGTDIDGMVGLPDELLAIMDAHGVERCFVFCLDEPDRHPAFRAANDRTLSFAEASDGRFVPFVRLDLEERPIDRKSNV